VNKNSKTQDLEIKGIKPQGGTLNPI